MWFINESFVNQFDQFINNNQLKIQIHFQIWQVLLYTRGMLQTNITDLSIIRGKKYIHFSDFINFWLFQTGKQYNYLHTLVLPTT